jgi:sodium/potassium-transporting ATPase subunit beta
MAEKKAEQFYTPPPKLGKWEGFRIFIWNSETHQFLGRTGASWGKRIMIRFASTH